MNLTFPQLHDYDAQIAPYHAGTYSLRNAVLEILQHAPHFLYETHDGNIPAPTDATVAEFITAPCDAAISLFAHSCYRMPVAEDITGALSEFYGLHGSQSNNIHLCLHEAIINGVIHGNLSVPGIFKTKESLADYYAWIEARLSSATTSESRIEIRASLRGSHLQLEVIDQGRGYLFNDYFGVNAMLQLHQGLNLIRASCQCMQVQSCGNHIVMEFEV